MKPEAQRIAISEACGHTYHKPTDDELKRGSYYQYEPDYLNDLNAMHEVEKGLGDDPTDGEQSQWMQYRRAIDLVCERDETDVIHASAEQRAEAFLRTIGKWEEPR